MVHMIMWVQAESVYRGQAPDGTVVTVAEDAMRTALLKAGQQVFESDWWTETTTNILEHWGIHPKYWVDDTTRMPRVDFVLGSPKGPRNESGPLTTRLMTGPVTGPLTTRLLSSEKQNDR